MLNLGPILYYHRLPHGTSSRTYKRAVQSLKTGVSDIITGMANIPILIGLFPFEMQSNSIYSLSIAGSIALRIECTNIRGLTSVKCQTSLSTDFHVSGNIRCYRYGWTGFCTAFLPNLSDLYRVLAHILNINTMLIRRDRDGRSVAGFFSGEIGRCKDKEGGTSVALLFSHLH